MSIDFEMSPDIVMAPSTDLGDVALYHTSTYILTYC